MPITKSHLWRAGLAAAASLLVAGCGSGRDEEMDKKLAAAQAAADRAVQAAESAERAAAAITARGAPETVFAEPEPPIADEPDTPTEGGQVEGAIADSPAMPPV